ncbi:APC family permease [Cellulosimicrobium sp. JZ28]|uniref:APC family permease n=1 Tax=Cellulosimicrobium sp. JZ28 TaxID=1906273 RepID=UPI001E505B91|nr:APC family permease [Cellulosimicrobium sp. JZ28]
MDPTTSRTTARPAPTRGAASRSGRDLPTSPLDRAPAPTPAGTLGLARGSALYVASVLGTGVLALPGLATRVAGPASVLAVALVLVASVPLAGTFAALAARHPDRGGVASAVRAALGPTAARATGYWFFLGVCAGVPVVAVLGAEYVVAVVGADRAVVPVVAVALVVVPALAVALGVRVAGAVQLGLTTLLLAAVVVVVAAAAPAASAERFTPFLSEGWSGVGSAVSLFVWAFAGWEVGTHVSADFRDPRRTIPAATGVALVVVGVAYLTLQVTTVGVLGTDAGTGTVALLDLARVGAPGAGPVLVSVVAAVVTSGVLTAYLAAFANLGQALARDARWPSRSRSRRATSRCPSPRGLTSSRSSGSTRAAWWPSTRWAWWRRCACSPDALPGGGSPRSRRP